ncbi:MAG: hypothetical protein H7267_07485 [Sandarakinorhabdus sp.]|nr:hypothetical protein [Sandarakinorhabdus sp.]
MTASGRDRPPWSPTKIPTIWRIQRGLRDSKKPGVTLAAYRESRLRHYHETLDTYMAADVTQPAAAAPAAR